MPAAIRVIIINFNAGDALPRCVASVLASRESLQVIVADNASTDGSAAKLRSLYRSNSRLEIVENARNLGFGRAVNACAAPAREPLLLILNPDCELRPGALSALRAAIDADRDAALAAPCVLDRNDRVLSGTHRSFPNPWKAAMTASGLGALGRWLPALRGVETASDRLPVETVRAEAVSGACMLVRAEEFRKLGGFDEDFEFHFEDLDLMWRLREAGRYCVYVPAAQVFHDAGTSSRSRPWWVHWQKHLGMQRFFQKHPEAAGPAWSHSFARGMIWAHYLATLPLVPFRR